MMVCNNTLFFRVRCYDSEKQKVEIFRVIILLNEENNVEKRISYSGNCLFNVLLYAWKLSMRSDHRPRDSKIQAPLFPIYVMCGGCATAQWDRRYDSGASATV